MPVSIPNRPTDPTADEQRHAADVSSPRKTGPGSVKRFALIASGWSAVGLAIAGVVLPILPTTPFLLLAAACFVRSSPLLHRRLLHDRRFGPYLRQWEHDRSIPSRAKLRAYAVVVVTFSISILVVDLGWLRLVFAGLGTGVIALIFLLRTTDERG